MIHKQLLAATTGVALAVAAPVALAQIPTTDVVLVAQSAANAARTISQLVEQLKQLKAQLNQAKLQYDSMTGSRGVGQLLSDENYAQIPVNWQQTLNMMKNGGGQYEDISTLADKVLRTMNGIDPKVFDQIDGAYGELYGEAAKQAAMYQALQGTEYNYVSARFKRLKKLIKEIKGAKDQKAILDLNTRIAAEQVMLKNEQLKMQALAQVREAQKDLQAAKARQAWIKDANGPAPYLGSPVEFWKDH